MTYTRAEEWQLLKALWNMGPCTTSALRVATSSPRAGRTYTMFMYGFEKRGEVERVGKVKKAGGRGYDLVWEITERGMDVVDHPGNARWQAMERARVARLELEGGRPQCLAMWGLWRALLALARRDTTELDLMLEEILL